jgi:hypothetical protein
MDAASRTVIDRLRRLSRDLAMIRLPQKQLGFSA